MGDIEMMDISDSISTRRSPTSSMRSPLHFRSQRHFNRLRRLCYEDGLFFFWYYHALIAFVLCSLIMTVILLEGCQKHIRIGPHIYLISLSYAPSSTTSNVTVPFGSGNQTVHYSNTSKTLDLQVRTGYFGTCISFDQESQFCGPLAALKNRVDNTSDPLDLLTIAHRFSSRSVSPVIPIMSVVAMALPLSSLMITTWDWSTLPLLFVALFGVCFLSLASAVWQSVATNAAASMTTIATHSYARAKIGIVAEALSWGIFTSQVLAGLGLSLALVAKLILSENHAGAFD